MTDRKLDVFFAFFPYGGNGGSSSEVPYVRKWACQTLYWCSQDPRIGRVATADFSDTPITMTRNRAVREAQIGKYDVLVMCDSDMAPDVELGRLPGTKPFFESSFNYLYERNLKGEYTVVGAPYCGPPPYENVYVFEWGCKESHNAQPDHQLKAFEREAASHRSGIEEVAALPTGLIMFDMKVWDLIYPPYFYYEWTDEYECDKASTEDVTVTRDIAILGQMKLGYSPIKVNWDAWAGHVKPKVVLKPRRISVDDIASKYRKALDQNLPQNETLRIMDSVPNVLCGNPYGDVPKEKIAE